MNISLTPELERYIQSKVETGLYTSASEVIRESLRLMNTYEEIQKHRFIQLDQAIEVGLAQLAKGEKIDGRKSYNRLKEKIKNFSKGQK